MSDDLIHRKAAAFDAITGPHFKLIRNDESWYGQYAYRVIALGVGPLDGNRLAAFGDDPLTTIETAIKKGTDK